MGRRPQRDLELLPHYVYKHFGDGGHVIYVGMTSDPDGRPTDTKQRPWIKTESKRIEVSPPMPYETATWVERSLIREISPKHNARCGNLLVEKRDWRIDRICEVEGVTVSTARWAVQYFPEDETEFEALLEARRLISLGLAKPKDYEELEALFGSVFT